MKQRSLTSTKDGSHTIFDPETNQHFHSVHGAIQESEHVFIEAGLKYFQEKERPLVNILEIGFGTGLNCLLTFLESEKSAMEIKYTTIEAFPLNFEFLEGLNYLKLLHAEKYKDQFFRMHQSEEGKWVQLSEKFHLKKTFQKLQGVFLEEEAYDLVYFDAFAPGAQPELWTAEIFCNIFTSMKKGAVLTTYCAKGDVKRNLKKAGFVIESLPGPPGKREMTRGLKGFL